MNFSYSIVNVILLFGLATAFVQFEDDVEYEFQFNSDFTLSPAFLGGGQWVNATLLVRKFRKFGTNLVIAIKNSHCEGKVDDDTKSNIEGVFGVRRSTDGRITHIVSKSQEPRELLTKRGIVSMLAENFDFLNEYLNTANAKRPTKHQVSQSVGFCNSDITVETDPKNGLSLVLAQAEQVNCNVDPMVVMTGQMMLHGTKEQNFKIKDDSNYATRVIFNTEARRIVEVAKNAVINLHLAGLEIQARHNMILTYVGEHPVTSATSFQKPYYVYRKEAVDSFLLKQIYEDAE